DSPTHERPFIPNMTRRRVGQAELGHHFLDTRTSAKSRLDRRALRRCQQPIAPARTPLLSHLISPITQHERTIVLRRPDESTAASDDWVWQREELRAAHTACDQAAAEISPMSSTRLIVTLS